jgi:hypothetical protein
MVFLVQECKIPFGENSLIEVHANSILGFERTVEYTSHVPMSTNRIGNMSNSSIFGGQLDRFKPIDVLYGKKKTKDKEIIMKKYRNTTRKIRRPDEGGSVVVRGGSTGGLPGLKNILRITTDFLWILKGSPVRMIRFSMIRAGSTSITWPVATKRRSRGK